MAFKVPEEFRIKNGRMGSDSSYGNNGAFSLKINGVKAYVIATDQGGWEHVSVTIRDKHRTPTWAEMCFVKHLFWGNDETVIQYHPPESEYVNNHPHCLHLWKPLAFVIPLPPCWMVGVKGMNEEEVKEVMGV